MNDNPAVQVAISSLYLSSDGAVIDVAPKAILESVVPLPKVNCALPVLTVLFPMRMELTKP